MAIRILGIALVLCVTVALGISESGSGVLPRGPRDCSDVYQLGNRFEGYYAVYPNLSNLDEAGLLFCSVNDGMLPRNNSVPKTNAKNCLELQDAGMSESGINVIYPLVDHPESPVIVYCEQGISGGGWTVFQRRDDFESQLDFYKSFNDYSVGFGNTGMEFWIGNDILHALTDLAVSELYVDLTSFDGTNKYAHYNSFFVGPKDPDSYTYRHKYQLAVSHFSGNAGDSLAYHSGMGFSTYDFDQDLGSTFNCADSSEYQGGWWYGNCEYSNLNGVYYENEDTSYNSVHWFLFANNRNALRKSVMMTRPLRQQ